MNMPPQYASPVPVTARRGYAADNMLSARSAPQFKVKPVTSAAAMSYSGWFSGRLVDATVGAPVPTTRRLTSRPDAFQNLPLTARRPETARPFQSFHSSIPGQEFTRPRSELLLARVQSAPTLSQSFLTSHPRVPTLGFGGRSQSRGSGRIHPVEMEGLDQQPEEVEMPRGANEGGSVGDIGYDFKSRDVNYDVLGSMVANKYGVALTPYDEAEKARLKTIRDETVKSLVKAMKEKFELKQPIKSRRHRYVLLAFETHDRHKSGFVAKKDFRKCLKILNNDIPEPQLSYLCDELPQSESGELVSYEFLMTIVNCEAV